MATPDDRDVHRFPHDPIGDQLWEMALAGDPLADVREVTFTIDFPTLTSVAVFMSDLQDVFPQRLQDRIAEQTLDVTLDLAPDHAVLTEVHAELEQLAEDHGAEMMGWGA